MHGLFRHPDVHRRTEPAHEVADGSRADPLLPEAQDEVAAQCPVDYREQIFVDQRVVDGDARDIGADMFRNAGDLQFGMGAHGHAHFMMEGFMEQGPNAPANS